MQTPLIIEKVKQSLSKLNISSVIVYILINVLAIIVPQILGLHFARYGFTDASGDIISSYSFVKSLDYKISSFFLIGFIPMFLMITTYMAAFYFQRTRKIFMWIAPVILAITLFICGFAYTRPNYTHPNFTVFHDQAYKIETLNLGIFTSLIAFGIYLVMIIIMLIIKRKTLYYKEPVPRRISFTALIIFQTIGALSVLLTPLLNLHIE